MMGEVLEALLLFLHKKRPNYTSPAGTGKTAGRQDSRAKRFFFWHINHPAGGTEFFDESGLDELLQVKMESARRYEPEAPSQKLKRDHLLLPDRCNQFLPSGERRRTNSYIHKKILKDMRRYCKIL